VALKNNHITKFEIMNVLKINFFRSFLVALVASLTFIVACDNEEQVSPDMSAYFKVRNVINDENPLEAPANMIFVNGSKNGLAYEWDFGDGYLKNDPDKTNTYIGVSPDTVLFPLPGTYEVKLTVIGGEGQKNETYSQTYVVNKETPKISYEPEDILVDTTVNFTVSYFLREGATATFDWSFEDGDPATSTVENPEVKFTSAGLKTVTLSLNDGDETITVSTQLEIKEELAPTLYFTDMGNQQIYKKRVFKTLESDLAEPVISTGIVLPDNSKPMTMVVDNRRVFVTNTDSNTGTATFG
jgi:PKD repeat protein